jgi:hypothetical protein
MSKHNVATQDRRLFGHMKFQAKSSSEISVTKGSKVSVIEKNFNGWLLIDTKDGQGKLKLMLIFFNDLPEDPLFGTWYYLNI